MTFYNLSPDKGYHSQKLNKLYGKKYPGRVYLPLKDAIRKLQNEGYITAIKKKEEKYYISNIPMAVLALEEHGFVNYLWAKDPEASCFIPQTIVHESTGPSPCSKGANILYSY